LRGAAADAGDVKKSEKPEQSASVKAAALRVVLIRITNLRKNSLTKNAFIFTKYN